ncbi:ATP-binding protein [Candidatus Binatia bacterium]|nr:ATP-binding protein [Candidatus Binatia bacterium]
MAQIESSRLTLHKEALNIDAFLTECVERHNRLAETKRTRVELTMDTVGYVHADPIRLRQVLDNLLSNAVKFSPPGSLIRVHAGKQDALWRVAVQDQGLGVTEEDRARLFRDFAQLSAKPTGDEKSTGLGLAISRRMVEAHGGRIGVDSAPGAGATFWFTLPV